MMSFFVTAFLSSSMLFAFATTPVPEKPVALTGSIQPDSSGANHFTVTVQMDIKKEWHTYDEVAEGAEQPTSLKFKLPEGVKSKGDWDRPQGNEGHEAEYRIYKGRVSFSRIVVVEPDAYGKSIDVIVSYQACTDEFCNPPQSKTVSIAIPVGSAEAGTKIFESPIRISKDGKPLNAEAKTRFPSPGIFDVDGDGAAELLIGGLTGSLDVYENQNTSGKGDPEWGSREPLKDAKGEKIRTSNW